MSGSLLQDLGNGSFVPAGPRPAALVPSALHRHRLQPLAKKPAGSLLIHEIYRSLQGESTFAGLPCVFIRLTACNLRCVYCDTAHAFAEGNVLDLDAVVDQALRLGDDLVEITGGEPLLQPEVYPLMTRLADAGKTVLLETSGAMCIDRVDPRVVRVLDVKTPGSGEVARNRVENFPLLTPRDQVKFVICSREDYDWSRAYLQEHALSERCQVLFSPSYTEVPAATLADWILADRLPVRFQLQLHKVLWGDVPGK